MMLEIIFELNCPLGRHAIFSIYILASPLEYCCILQKLHMTQARNTTAGSADFFCGGSNSKIFWLCERYGLCHKAYFCFCHVKAIGDNSLTKWTGLCSNKTFFPKQAVCQTWPSGCSLLTKVKQHQAL